MARRPAFPLHQRCRPCVRRPVAADVRGSGFRPSPLAPRPSAAVTLLKPLKGCDPATEDCLRSWFTQQYTGPVQILFGVAAADDPVCAIVRKLLQEFPAADAQLVVCNAAARRECESLQTGRTRTPGQA